MKQANLALILTVIVVVVLFKIATRTSDENN